MMLGRWGYGVALGTLWLSSCAMPPSSLEADHPATPEALVRAMFEANATRNMRQLERLVSKDMVGYSIGGRKYVGWDELKPEMQQEFEAVSRLEIPVKDLRIWKRKDLAWYTAEVNYIRYIGTGRDAHRMVLSLQESGVVERQRGRWLLVQWHESLEQAPNIQPEGGHVELAPATPSQSASIGKFRKRTRPTMRCWIPQGTAPTPGSMET
jgi:hypothetical protein